MSRILTPLLVAISLILSGCAAVTITESGDSDFTYHPDYEQSKPFFLWGLVGEHQIDVTEICDEKKVIQMQSKFSAMNVLYSGLTLGIYLPRTAKVWCEREEEI